MSSPDLENYRKELSLDGNSRIIVLSTEGGTDNYREVVDENNPF
ncbi:hypothetical protein [Lactobacillus taiwanensis]|nr:hypothetical protein [Lactobacillus taiwanensis]